MTAEPHLVPRDVVCIGASSGGVGALSRLVAQLRPGLPATVLVVLHTAPSSPGALPDILARASHWPAAMARHGQALEHGHILVAPPDHHLAIVDGRVALHRGPPENRVRPAVDVLFRSAAASCGARVIGVVLTGHLDDGSSGARAIKRAGGVLVVQSPSDAEAPSMPQSAIAAATPDYVVPIAAMGELIRALVGTLAPRSAGPEASIPGDGHAHERVTAQSLPAHSASSIAPSSPCEPEAPANDVQSAGPGIRR